MGVLDRWAAQLGELGHVVQPPRGGPSLTGVLVPTQELLLSYLAELTPFPYLGLGCRG